MNLAQSSLIFKKQDGKMLSCTGWFISIMVCLLNINIMVLSLVVLGFLECVSTPTTLAIEPPQIEIKAKEKYATEKNEFLSWIEAKNVKYAKYKLDYPADGIIHAKGVVSNGNAMVKVNILEVNKKVNSALEIKPQTASHYLNSRVKIGTIANRTGAIAAVNGGYFKPRTGVPLGALVIDNELLTGSIYNRVALGINGDGTYSMGKTDIKISLREWNFNLKADNINQPRMLSTYTLIYTNKWGKISPPPPKYGLNAVIVNGAYKGAYSTAVEIPSNGFVVSAPEKVIKSLAGKKRLSLYIKYPEAFDNSLHIISGGPYLVKNGEIFIDVKEEKLTSITGRNPRTLVGYTKNNELIIVTVDGRESHSVGMSLYEAAKFMQKLGCINAMNLDGGSSSVMYVKGKVANTPPSDGGIPISGALVVGLNKIISGKPDGNSRI